MNLKKTKTVCLIFCAVFAVCAFALSPVEVNAETTEFLVSDRTELFNAVKEINKAEGGNFAIILGGDIVLEGNEKWVTFSSNSTTTIYGGGHTLTVGNLVSFEVSGNAVVNLGAEGYGETLKITAPGKGNCTVSILKSGTLNMYDNVVIGDSTTDSTFGAGIQMQASATFNMYGGTISNCVNQRRGAGAVYAEGDAAFNMYGGTISNCSSVEGAGGVLVTESAEFNMHGGTITECKFLGPFNGVDGAGGVLVKGTAVFDMQGGTISSCYSTEGAGGVVVTESAEFNMHGGTITECKFLGHYTGAGGVLVRDNAKFSMHGGTITECGFSEPGAVGAGGVYVSGEAIFEMHGGEISNCYGSVAAAGVYVDMQATFTMYNGTITECKIKVPSGEPTEGVGGVSLVNEATFIMLNGAITKCEIPESSTGAGGVLVADSTTFEMRGGEITGCKTGYLGGGGVALYYGNVTVSAGAKIYDNKAIGCGDDIFVNGSEDALLTLGEVPRGLTLSDCGSEHEIDGWYIDGLKGEEKTPRWFATPCGQSAQGENYAEKYLPTGVISTGIALKAAHGTEPSPPEPEQPAPGPTTPTEPEKPQPEKPAHTPVRDTVTVEIGGEKPQAPAEENPDTGAPVLKGVVTGVLAAAKSAAAKR